MARDAAMFDEMCAKTTATDYPLEIAMRPVVGQYWPKIVMVNFLFCNTFPQIIKVFILNIVSLINDYEYIYPDFHLEMEALGLWC